MIVRSIWSCVLVTCCVAARAQPDTRTGVLLYGSVDAAAAYIDNAAGKSLKRLDSGSLYANRLGFRGVEDLGDGLKAIFTLEDGFNVDDGTTTLGGRFFGRQSFVGLSGPGWGTVTFGRQYDFLYAGSPLPLDVGALLIGGLAGASGGAGTSVDNHSGGVRYDNAVKWVTQIGAWSLGAMYGLGSENGSDKMASAVLNYRSGPLWVGAAYLRDNFSPAASGNRIALAGLNWNVTPANQFVLTVSSAKAATPADSHSENRMVQAGWLYRIRAALVLGAMAGRADSRDVKLADGRLNQYGLGAQYEFSKRTMVYGIWSGVHSGASAGTAYSGVPGIGAPASTLRSSTSSQNVAKVGVLHRF